jgi:ferritin
MNKKMLDAFNEQMRREFHSAYIYLEMAAHFDAENLSGMAAWMKAQHGEEIEHAMKFYNYIVERGGRPVIPGIDKPELKISKPIDAFEAAFKHEKYITKSIDELYDLAVKENDKPAQIFLNWFVEEQVEEEDNVGGVVDTMKMIGDSGQALYMLDRQLGQRQG